jgi:hypothetical protein
MVDTLKIKPLKKAYTNTFLISLLSVISKLGLALVKFWIRYRLSCGFIPCEKYGVLSLAIYFSFIFFLYI